MDTQLLEEIGLTKGEIAVYFALLELGSTTVGPITEKAKVSSSKVYEILERLMQKGLVSFVIKENTKYFEAAPPEQILEYLKEREEKISQQKKHVSDMLPELNLKKTLARYKSEATIFKGIKGAKTAMDDVLHTMKKGEEYYVFGSVKPTPVLLRFFKNYHLERAKKGIKVKLLFAEYGPQWKENLEGIPLADIKFAENQMLGSTFVLLYKDKTLLTVSNEDDITLFRIENKGVTDSFKAQFKLLWNQDIQTLRGDEGIITLCELVIKEKKDLYLIGANAVLPKNYPKYFLDWEKRRVDLDIKRHQLSIEKTRTMKFDGLPGLKFNELPKTQARYLPSEFESPIVIWVFGNKVAHTIWNKLIVFLVDNKQIADDYRKYFNLLWSISKP